MDLQGNSGRAVSGTPSQSISQSIMETANRSYYYGRAGAEGPDTRSQSITEIVSGSHYFQIRGYSSKKGRGVGKYIASDNFIVGGHTFSIYFYPDGKRAEDNSEYISVFLTLISGRTVRALFQMVLVDHRFNPREEVHSNFKCPPGGPPTLEYGGFCGSNRAYKRTLLEGPNFLKNDTLLISCKVGVVVSRKSQKLYSISAPEPDIGQHFRTLLPSSIDGDATFGDVIFEVDGEEFHGHKLVLAARSPVFKSQLYGPMCCRSTGKIQVKDIVAPVFEAMLHFIYSDVLPDTFEVEATTSSSSSSTLMAQHLLVAADRYGLNRLRLMCESKLCEDLTTETVAATLILADQHQASQLKAHCLQYAAANLAAVLRSEGFEDLKNSRPSLQWEILRTVAGLGLPISQQ